MRQYKSKLKNLDNDFPDIPSVDEIIELSDDPIEFTRQVRILKGERFSFEGRDYLYQLYRDDAKTIRISKGRQTEMSEMLVNKLFENAFKFPGTIHLYMADRNSHTSKFSNLRVRDWGIKASRTVQNMIAGLRDHSATVLKFINGSQAYFHSAWSGFEEARSVPADFVYVDERNAVDGSKIVVLKETLSHSKHGRMWEVGTGPIEGTDWDEAYKDGTQYEWNVKTKSWVPRNPGAKVHSYNLPQTIVPWISAEEIEEKRIEYTDAQFAMEVLGRSHRAASKPITPQMMNAIMDNNLHLLLPSEIDHTKPLYCGIDWGGGEKAFTVPSFWQLMDPAAPRFQLAYIEKITESDQDKQWRRVRDLIEAYKPDSTVQDIGGAPYQIRKIEEHFGHEVRKCLYLGIPGKLWDFSKLWTKNMVEVNRTYAIDNVISLIRDGRDRIPSDDEEKVDFMIDHYACIEAKITRSSSGQDIVTYIKPVAKADDALHSRVFAWVAWYLHQRKDRVKGAFATGKMGGR